jgi:hypothetical protein
MDNFHIFRHSFIILPSSENILFEIASVDSYGKHCHFYTSDSLESCEALKRSLDLSYALLFCLPIFDIVYVPSH